VSCTPSRNKHPPTPPQTPPRLRLKGILRRITPGPSHAITTTPHSHSRGVNLSKTTHTHTQCIHDWEEEEVERGRKRRGEEGLRKRRARQELPQTPNHRAQQIDTPVHPHFKANINLLKVNTCLTYHTSVIDGFIST